MFHHRIVAMSFAVLCALVSGHADAVQRAHVSALVGLDSNTSFNCDVAHPCRFFQAATAVVDFGGEVVVLDSGGYGAVSLTKSIALVAPDGVYAGITVFPGAVGVTIATAGISVALRGLTINSLGGTRGISMTDGTRVSIENCVISNFTGSSSYSAIFVSTGADVRISDTVVRDNANGIWLEGGARATISKSKILGYGGILVYGSIANTTTTATISDTVITGAFRGINVYSIYSTAIARAAVARSTITNAVYGVDVTTSSFPAGAVAQLTMGDTLVTENSTGVYRTGAGATIFTLGNNTIHLNRTDFFDLGGLTSVAPR